MTFHIRIFVILGFKVVWSRQPQQPQKELGEYFQWLHFWNQWVPLIKMHCRVRYLFDFDLKICSSQVWLTNFCKLLSLTYYTVKLCKVCFYWLIWEIKACSNILFVSNNWNGQYQKGDSDSFWKTFQNINVTPCDTNFDS